MYKDGQIIAFRTPLSIKPISWLSSAIRFFAKVKYNHVGIIITLYGRAMVAESVGRGFIVTPLSDRIEGKRYQQDYVIFRCEYKKYDPEKIRTEAIMLLGKTPYDVRGLIDQAIWNTFNVWKGKIGKEAMKRMYCYESMAYLHRRSKTFKNWWLVKPSDLFKSKEFSLLEIFE
jgi:hypothetical protein